MTGGTIISDGGIAVSGGGCEASRMNISGGTITGKTAGVTVGVATASITGGSITATNGPGISATSGTVTVGKNEGETPSTTNPSITGSTYGVEITTGRLNFYSGKIVGKQTTKVKGVDVAFKINSDSNVTYRTGGYGAHTEGPTDGKYTTTLAIPTIKPKTTSEKIYLNTSNNKTKQVEVEGTDYGTLSYSIDKTNIAEIDPTTGVVTAKAEGKATITITEANGGIRTTCEVIVDDTKPVWKVNVKEVR